MGPRALPASGLILDAGALILLDRGDDYGRILGRGLAQRRSDVVVPSGALAQVWRPPGSRRALLHRLLTLDHVTVMPLDEPTAFGIGTLLAQSGTSDVVDAQVALAGMALRGVVLTSDPDDIAALGAEVLAL
ncbi:MAG: hypothetical protein MSC31_18105 [Solirubrobacteraceae bacterium MAG38_C4-C5]|nr:hypothetical protein [Candidatus Siliceabacter maunaloa]